MAETITDSAGNEIISNGILIDNLIFPLELDPINKWIYNYVKSLKSAINENFLNLLLDINKFYNDCPDACKTLLLNTFKGMWPIFDSYARVPDISLFETIFSSLSSSFLSAKIMADNTNVNSSSVNIFCNSSNSDIANSCVINESNICNDKFKKKHKRSNIATIDNDDGFIKPMKTAKVVNTNLNMPISVKNSFENLSEMTELNDNNVIDNNDTDTDSANVKPKGPRPEPIHLKLTSNWRDISAKIDEITKTKIGKVFQGDCIKFVPKTVEQYRIIQNYFAQQNYEFFGLKLKNERPRKVLLKGIPIDVNVDEIKDELVCQNFSIHRVAQLKNFKTKLPMPIFMVDIFPDDNFKNIFDIRSVLGFLVKVEIYKFKGTRQCYNCQRFNHSSEVCGFKPVCVKCAGEHRSKQCPLPPNDRKNIKCANCLGNHTANFGGCPKNPRNVQKTKITTIKDSPKTFQSAKIKENVSFANLVKGTILPPVSNLQPISVNNDTIDVNNKSQQNDATSVKNVVNTCVPPAHQIQKTEISSNIDLLTSIIVNNVDIDALIEKLNKLFNILSKFSKLLNDDGMEKFIKILGVNSISQLASSSISK